MIISGLSTCGRADVGALSLNRVGLIGRMGFNGAPRGMEHCGDDCAYEGHCARSIHAEDNAIVPGLEEGTLFCTHRPCPGCQLKIIKAGIKYVWYVHDYNPGAPDLLAEAGIECLQYRFSFDEHQIIISTIGMIRAGL